MNLRVLLLLVILAVTTVPLAIALIRGLRT
jgi:hypothetical protein